MYSQTNFLKIIFIISAFTLIGAWYFELVLGLEPCPLCLTQRIPYYVALFLCFIYLFLRRLEFFFLTAFFIIFSISLFYGVYHAGAEWSFWQGPKSCGAGKGISQNVDNLLNSLNEIKIIDCTNAAWRLFGISLAGYNAIISAGLFLLSAYNLFKKKFAFNATKL